MKFSPSSPDGVIKAGGGNEDEGDVLRKRHGGLPVVPSGQKIRCQEHPEMINLLTNDPQSPLSIPALPGNTLPAGNLSITDLSESSFQSLPDTFQMWFLSKSVPSGGTVSQQNLLRHGTAVTPAQVCPSCRRDIWLSGSTEVMSPA